jgi:hypothetical protein
MTDDLVKRLRLNDREIYLPLLGQAADRIEALTAENERLREAGAKLNNHACHDDDCQIVTHGVWSDPIPCTCGYEDAWKAWSAALGDT